MCASLLSLSVSRDVGVVLMAANHIIKRIKSIRMNVFLRCATLATVCMKELIE